MNSPLVSFIIPYFNAGVTIQETIESVFNQSYANFDIWIINDGSTDPFSIEKLKDFEANEKIHILHQENAGPSVARNNAIKQSNASFFIPLDADDLIEKTTISECIQEMSTNNKIGIVYGNLHFFGDLTEVKVQQQFSLERQILWNQIAVCCLIRKRVFDDVGLYDEYLSKLGLEDWEFWIRVGVSNWEFKKIENVHFYIRVNSLSRTFEVANQNLSKIKEYVCQKHAHIWMEEYEKKYYAFKILKETPDFKIGKFIMSPYRFIKKKLFGYE